VETVVNMRDREGQIQQTAGVTATQEQKFPQLEEENLRLSRVKHERREMGGRGSPTPGGRWRCWADSSSCSCRGLSGMGSGIRHELPVVWNSALYMLGQFAEFIQPAQRSPNHAHDIPSVLLDYLDCALASLTVGGKDMGVVVPRLEQYLAMQRTDDRQVLLTQVMATLVTLARAVGEQHFSKEFAEIREVH
jgi:hypothetical protein